MRHFTTTEGSDIMRKPVFFTANRELVFFFAVFGMLISLFILEFGKIACIFRHLRLFYTHIYTILYLLK